MFNASSLIPILQHIREKKPLIHNITNLVVTQFTANILLSLGASPAMIHAEEEVREFIQKANALVINLGTLSSPQARSMLLASQTAYQYHIPWVLDPVALTASTFRSQTTLKLLKNRPNAIRGNASEIINLYLLLSGQEFFLKKGKGVDSLDSSETALEMARKLAILCQTIISVSGKTDYITNGKETIAIQNGHSLLTKITGSGCAATAITAACLAVENNSLHACAAAMAFLGIATDIAMAYVKKAPGSLQIALLDELYTLDTKSLMEKARIQILNHS